MTVRKATLASISAQPLLTRLLGAIAAGGLFVAPGCGAKTTAGGTSTSDEPDEEVTTPAPTNEETTAHETSTSDTSSGATTDTGLQCEYGRPQQFCLKAEQMESKARYGIGQVPLDPPRTDEQVAAGFDDNGCMRHDWVATSCCNPAEAPGVPQDDGSCCYVACEGACCGRPLVVNGQALVAEVQSRADWLRVTREQPEAELPFEAAQVLADAWLADGQMEHASIASFSRFALDLLALGAPPQLLADAQRAALDEIEHARRCFSIASRLAQKALGPGSLSVDALNVHSLNDAVRAAIAEGCVGETLAAGIAREQAAVAGDAEVRSALSRIAGDELRHAELAWRFVAWAISMGGDPVRQVAAASFEQHLSKVPRAPEAPNLDVSLLNHWGRLSEDQWACTASSIVNQVLVPAARALLDSPASTVTPGARSAASA